VRLTSSPSALCLPPSASPNIACQDYEIENQTIIFVDAAKTFERPSIKSIAYPKID
jgi:hypothetical protein